MARAPGLPDRPSRELIDLERGDDFGRSASEIIGGNRATHRLRGRGAGRVPAPRRWNAFNQLPVIWVAGRLTMMTVGAPGAVITSPVTVISVSLDAGNGMHNSRAGGFKAERAPRSTMESIVWSAT